MLSALETIHPYVFAVGGCLITLETFIAGIMSPTLSVVRASWGRARCNSSGKPHSNKSTSKCNRYAHSHHRFLQVFCLLVFCGIIGGIVYSGMVHYEKWSLTAGEFLEWTWYICDYWEHARILEPVPYAWWMTMGFCSIDLVFTTIFALMNAWPPEDLKDPSDLQEREAAEREELLSASTSENAPIISITVTDPNTTPVACEITEPYSSPNVDDQYRHGFVVVTHNSSDILAASARAILRRVEPWQLFFADNGSSAEEEVASDRVCEELTEEYRRKHPNYQGPGINISHIGKGSKTWAQYAAVEHLAKFNESMASNPKYSLTNINVVTLMDDDVILPYNWSQEKANREFDNNSRTIAIAYPLRADNPESSVWARFQDLEYLMGDAERATQDWLGTNLFCSGAIATWKLNVFKRVLERHDATFHGEDIEMGWITHKLSGRTKLEGGEDNVDNLDSTHHRIALMRDCVVPTTVPIHFSHWWDYLPVDLTKMMGCKRACECGEASLHYQRSRSWDIANHSFFFRFLLLVFSPGGLGSWTKFFARVVCFWKVVGILREYIFIFGIVLYCIMNPYWMSILSLLVFMGDALLIWWGLYTVVLFIQNMRFRQSHLQVRSEVLVCYPPLFLFNLTTFVRPVAAFYNVFYYWPFVHFAKPIRNQLREDDDLRGIVDGAWDISRATKTVDDVTMETILSVNSLNTLASSANSLQSPHSAQDPAAETVQDRNPNRRTNQSDSTRYLQLEPYYANKQTI